MRECLLHGTSSRRTIALSTTITSFNIANAATFRMARRALIAKCVVCGCAKNCVHCPKDTTFCKPCLDIYQTRKQTKKRKHFTRK